MGSGVGAEESSGADGEARAVVASNDRTVVSFIVMVVGYVHVTWWREMDTCVV